MLDRMLLWMQARASAENFPGGGNEKKDRKLAKIPKNSTI